MEPEKGPGKGNISTQTTDFLGSISHRINVCYKNIYLHFVDFYGKLVGKYIVRPMDPMGIILAGVYYFYNHNPKKVT